MEQFYFDINDLTLLNEFVQSQHGSIKKELLNAFNNTFYNSWFLEAHVYLKNRGVNITYLKEDIIQTAWISGVYKLVETLEHGLDTKRKHYKTKIVLFAFCRNQLRWRLLDEGYEQQKEKQAILNLAIPITQDFQNIFELKDLVRKAIQELDEDERQYIKWRYFEDMLPTEIAEHAGITYRNVLTRLSRARKSLRTIIQKLIKN